MSEPVSLPKYALLSLFSKEDKAKGVVLGQTLVKKGYTLLSTGGTAQSLKDAGLHVVEVSDLTKFPEMLDGRVKTLDGSLHARILAKPKPEHEQALTSRGWGRIGLVAVTLYDFVGKYNEIMDRLQGKPLDRATLLEVMEQIDIGGPTIWRGAGKNWPCVINLCDTNDYVWVANAMDENGSVSDFIRYRLASKAFNLVAEYDRFISSHLPGDLPEA